jgi:hypothetical protein
MFRWIDSLDRLLRGELTQMHALRRDGLRIPIRGTTFLLVLLGAIYGVCMGTFALLHPEGPRWIQMLASSLKVPALFLLTLAVTFPSLYVFNALVGSQLRVLSVLRLLVAALSVTLAVLASLGPIIAFFSVSTTSYAFMILLNVIAFAVAGLLGLMFLLQTLHRLSLIQSPAEQTTPPAETAQPVFVSAEPTTGQPSAEPMPLAPIDQVPGSLFGTHVKVVFRCWAVVFALVGAQMAWVLRPFIGAPNQPFTWFRPRESNFFEAVANTIYSLFK